MKQLDISKIALFICGKLHGATDSTGYEQTVSYHAGLHITLRSKAFCCLLYISSASKPRQQLFQLDVNGKCLFLFEDRGYGLYTKRVNFSILYFYFERHFQNFCLHLFIHYLNHVRLCFKRLARMILLCCEA